MLIECSRRFSTSTQPTKNASEKGVGQNAQFSGDCRTTVRASPSAAHRLIVAHQAANVPHTAGYRSLFASTRARPHRQMRRLWPTRSIEPVERSRNFGPAATGYYKYRPLPPAGRHFWARRQSRSTHGLSLRFKSRSTLLAGLQYFVILIAINNTIIHNNKSWVLVICWIFCSIFI